MFTVEEEYVKEDRREETKRKKVNTGIIRKALQR